MVKKISKLLTIVLTMAALCGMGRDSAHELMQTDSLEHWIKKDSEERVVEALAYYTLPDTIVFKGSLRNVWYTKTIHPQWGDQYISSGMLKINNRYYASDRLKALYWLWLLYQGKEELCQKTALLVKSSSRDTLFDYADSEIGTVYQTITHPPLPGSPAKRARAKQKTEPMLFAVEHHGRIIKETNQSILEVEALYRKWLATVQEKGLAWVRKEHVSPLGNQYEWVIVDWTFSP